MSTKISCVVFAAVSMAVLVGGRADAQEPDPRPFRGIFGAPVSPNSPHSLILTGSLFAAYDDSQIDGLLNPATGLPGVQHSGAYQGADATLDYNFRKTGNRFSFGGQAGAQVQYFRQKDRSRVLPGYRGDLSLSTRLTSSLTVDMRQTATYTSNYNSGLASGFGDPQGRGLGAWGDPALDLFQLRGLRTVSSVSMSNRFGQYTSLSGGYFYRSFHVLSSDGQLAGSRFYDYGSHAGRLGILYARPMSRHASLRLGYGVNVSDQESSNGEPQVMHTVDAGVNYARALSFSRRTQFSFGTGSGIAVTERDTVPDGQQRTTARLIVNAALVHQIGRTWTAQLDYNRGFRTQDGFDELYFTDALQATLDGLFTRRLSFTAAARWDTSSIQTLSGGNQRRQAANVRLQYALTSYLALYSQYLYHYYRFTDDVRLDPRLPRRLDRQGVRAGLTATVPLIR